MWIFQLNAFALCYANYWFAGGEPTCGEHCSRWRGSSSKTYLPRDLRNEQCIRSKVRSLPFRTRSTRYKRDSLQCTFISLKEMRVIKWRKGQNCYNYDHVISLYSDIYIARSHNFIALVWYICDAMMSQNYNHLLEETRVLERGVDFFIYGNTEIAIKIIINKNEINRIWICVQSRLRINRIRINLTEIRMKQVLPV